MSHIFVVRNSTKSWAYALEESIRNNRNNSVILDFTACFTWRPATTRRILIQKKTSNGHRIKWIKIRRIGSVNLLSLLVSLKFVVQFHIENRKLLPEFGAHPEFINEALICRLSQTMGSRNFSLPEIPLLYLFRFIREASLAEFAYSRLKERHSEITLFNGREPLEAVIIRKAIDLGIKVSLTERASSNSKFELYSISPHFQPEWWVKAQKFWVDSQPLSGEKLLKNLEYLERKSNGYDSFLGQKWNTLYTKEQIKLDITDPYVVFFSTSSHEYSPIREFNSQIGFEDQLEAVLALQEVCREVGLPLIVRRHPNSLSPYDNLDRDRDFWKKVEGKNTLILDPDQKLNSLELAKGSLLTFVWRSSIGIEALYCGVRTYALGSARWALDSSVRAWTREEIKSAIFDYDQDSKSVLDVYSNYMAHGGMDLVYFKEVNRHFITTRDGSRIYMYIGDRIRANLKYRYARYFKGNLIRKA
jgi:hypothetical protein